MRSEAKSSEGKDGGSIEECGNQPHRIVLFGDRWDEGSNVDSDNAGPRRVLENVHVTIVTPVCSI